MKISLPSRIILTAFCSTVAFLLVLLSSQITQQASVQKTPAQRRAAQVRAEMRLIPVEMRRAVFSKGRWMLQMKNVPFDPDMLIRPRWRERLKPAFARMSEMSAIRREGRLLSGVYMADTLSLPEEIQATGDLLILAREVVFDGPNPVIRGKGNVYLFFIEPPKSRVSTGQLRNSLLRKASFYRSTGSNLLTLSSISWSSALRTWVQGECNLTVNKDGPTPFPFNDNVDGFSPLPKGPRLEVAPPGADGTCVGDPNGQRGNTGVSGEDGDDGGNGVDGTNGTHATGAIMCDIPDGAIGNYEFYARGHRGGNGGKGGRGGDGGQGGKGGTGGRGANCCASLGIVGNGGPGGPGGRGGQAGSGGDGGSGGKGGNGKDITVTYPANFSVSNITAINTGGDAGGAGNIQGAGSSGQGGDPGDGGQKAPSSFPSCGTSLNGQSGGSLGGGDSAFTGGQPGGNGNHGDHGSQNITPKSSSSTDDDGDGFSEDDGDCNDDPDQNGASYYPNAPVDCSDFADPEADRNCNGLPDQAEDCPNSPIIINFSGNLKLTSPDDGVDFDIRADGTKIRLSWTSPGSDDSFLALDRNGNGTIDNGAELFGNHTPMGNGQKAHNGFEALGWYDLPINGGNGNGIIDDGDSLFSTLLVWQDINHNGISEPAELRTLTAAAIAAIEVEYHYSRRRDRYGNEYRYRAKVFLTREGDSWGHKRFAYDIFLASG